MITFQVEGEGEIAGVGNGNPADVSSFQLPQKKVFHGRGLVIIRPNGKSGKINLVAKAKGLKSGQIEISSR
jgi:beta-galactosidase